MLDFIFRPGNPTNTWHRSRDLTLTVALDVPSINDVALGEPFEHLSFLGRNHRTQFDTLSYDDLGIGVDHADDGTLEGFSVVLPADDNGFRPYNGTLLWKRHPFDISQVTLHELSRVIGECYWLDSDDEESIAFYEYPEHEMQVELTPSGLIKRFILTRFPLLSDSQQRQAYKVDKPWPPRYRK